MLIVDVNLLLYAINRDSAHHERARTFWERSLSQDEHVGLTWLVILAFLRLSTNARVLERPLTAEVAARVVDEWLEQPPVEIVHPTARHWDVLKDLIRTTGTAGNLTSDAHLAAIAIEHGARLCSADRDFGRFPNLRWENPLTG